MCFVFILSNNTKIEEPYSIDYGLVPITINTMESLTLPLPSHRYSLWMCFLWMVFCQDNIQSHIAWIIYTFHTDTIIYDLHLLTYFLWYVMVYWFFIGTTNLLCPYFSPLIFIELVRKLESISERIFCQSGHLYMGLHITFYIGK